MAMVKILMQPKFPFFVPYLTSNIANNGCQCYALLHEFLRAVSDGFLRIRCHARQRHNGFNSGSLNSIMSVCVEKHFTHFDHQC